MAQWRNGAIVFSTRPPASKSIHLLPSRSSTTAIHTHRSLRFSSRLAPKYVHTASSAIVDATIVDTLPLARHALIARIRSSAISPFFDPTAHRCSACAHYARRRRYARALYAHLNRLPLDLLREARPRCVRRVLPLAIAALVNLTPACVSIFGHPIGAAMSASDVVSIWPLARHISHPR